MPARHHLPFRRALLADLALFVLLVSMATSCRAQPRPVPDLLPPPEGAFYHGVYPGGTSGYENDVTPEQLAEYERAVGHEAIWVTFSDDWFVSRAFPQDTVDWIVARGKIPYIRLMLRSDAEGGGPDEVYTLEAILEGRFDRDLRAWGEAAARVRSPIIVEWGTEANGGWFPWNGRWNGGADEGPRRFQDAYRHIVRTIAAPNLTWVFHVNASDDPDEAWNALENYYPGDGVVDWLGVSVYGSQEPGGQEARSFERSMDEVVPRLRSLAPDKPIFVVEFGTARGGAVRQDVWATRALDALLGRRWPEVRGFAWWNEAWPLDDGGTTTMRVQDEPSLAEAFRRALSSGDLQATPRIVTRDVGDRLQP